MLPRIDRQYVWIYQSPLEWLPQSNLNPCAPSLWVTGFKRILLNLFGLFFSAELSMGTLVVAPRPSCPHVQGPASLGTPAAIPIPSPICPENLHTSLVQVVLTYRTHKVPTPPRPQGTSFLHSSHHFLSDSSFSGSCLQRPMYPRQKLWWCWLWDVSKYMKLLLITLGSPKNKTLTLLLGSGDGDIYIFIIFISLY